MPEIKCKLCNCDDVSVIYKGPIKTGLLDGYTHKDYEVYQCGKCETIWNEAYKDVADDFYESEEYRKRIEGDSEIATYHKKHDSEVLDKLNMTGTAIFRDKIVADIGCAAGSFLEFLHGVAKTIIAVEPSKKYRDYLTSIWEGGIYSYASDALPYWGNKVDVVTSFDVIEHVEDVQRFADEIYELCAPGGRCIIGTPTDYPVLRKMLGREFDKFIFQVQHPWVLSEKSFFALFKNAGFRNITIKTRQKYGLGNLLAWLNERKPRGDIKYDFISETIDAAYKAEMGKYNAEYLVLYAEK